MAGGGFAVSVKLIDLATGPILKVNNALEAVEKTAKRAAREGGLFEVRDALGKMRKEAAEVADKFGEIFTPLAGLGAAGSLAGMASLAERFARVGTQAARSSAIIGESTNDLQKWAGAQRLAGGSADAAIASIKALSNALYTAKAGLNQTAFLTANQFQLDIAKKPVDFMLDLADRIRNNPRLRNNANAQRLLLSNLGISEELLPLLQKGSEGIRSYFAEVDRAGILSEQQIGRAEDLDRSYRHLTQSVESFGHAIGEDLGFAMKPSIERWSEWIDKARETPAIMKSVELGVDALATVMAVSLAGSLAKVLWWSNAVWAAPLFRFLASPAGAIVGGLGGLTYGGYLGLEKQGREQGTVANPFAPEQTLSPETSGGRPAADEHGMGALGRWLGGTSVGRAIWGDRSAPAARPSAGGALGREGWYNNPGNIRTSDAAWLGKGLPYTAGSSGGFETFASPELGVRAMVKNIQAKFARGITTPAQLAPVLGPASDNNNPGRLAEQYAKALGIGINDQIPNTPEAFKKLAPAIAKIEKNYEAQKRYTADVYNKGVDAAFDPSGGESLLSKLGRALIPSAKAAPMPGFGGANNFRAWPGIDLAAINPNLLEISRAAAAGLPPGYSVEVTSGARAGGLGGSQHHGGNALDAQIIGPDGQQIPNRGEDATGLYGRYARLALGAQMKLHPELAGKLGWGGNFETSPGSGVPDLMHLDLGGDRGRYGSLGALGPLYPDKPKAEPYGPPVPTAGEAVGKQGEADTDDTRHHVEVHFKNAPSGMRSGLTRADGPASVAVRTQYAMDGVV